MIRAAALGLTLVVTTLLTGCGIVVTDAAPTDAVAIAAPPLVPVFPEVEALAPAPTRALSATHARRLARRAALQILIPACDDKPKGRGFALGAHTLIGDRDLFPGSGWLRVWTANGRSTAVGPASAYRLGDLGLARVARTLPRRLRLGGSVAAGASVVAVTERGDELRMLPGVVVDGVSGAEYDARTKVLRLTSAVREGDVGPVLDAKGRIVAVVFAVDPRTTLGVALPVSALRAGAAAKTLEPRDACKD